MKKEIRAIVILYTGSEINESDCTRLANTLVKNCNTTYGDITIKTFDSSGLTKAAIGRSLDGIITIEEKEKNGLSAALTYIGATYEKAIKKSPTKFAAELYEALSEGNSNLTTACQIIRETNPRYVVSHVKAREFGINDIHIDIIKRGLDFLNI